MSQVVFTALLSFEIDGIDPAIRGSCDLFFELFDLLIDSLELLIEKFVPMNLAINIAGDKLLPPRDISR